MRAASDKAARARLAAKQIENCLVLPSPDSATEKASLGASC
jgi:hypothetical protein